METDSCLMIRRAGDGSPLGKGRRGREHRGGEHRGGVRVAGRKWQSGGVGATRAKFDQHDDGVLGLYVRLQASVKHVWYLYNARTLMIGVVTWSGQAAVFWANFRVFSA
jgi:hypothetical protein